MTSMKENPCGNEVQSIKIYPWDWDFYSIIGIPRALIWQEHKEDFF